MGSVEYSGFICGSSTTTTPLPDLKAKNISGTIPSFVIHKDVKQLGIRMFHVSSNPHVSSLDKHNTSKANNNTEGKTLNNVLNILRNLKEYQNTIVSLSLGSFLLYFLWYREESDIDEMMDTPMWKKVNGIDPATAARMVECDKKLGLDVRHAEKHLEEYRTNYKIPK